MGARDLAILSIFLDSGLRLSELVGLRVQDVHLQQGWLKVYGKGDKERIVPFGVRATKVLSRYVTFFRPQDLETDSFFVNIDGGPITQNTIKMLFVRLQQRSGVERLHPHLMRHTFAAAARNERLRAVLLASVSSRFLTVTSTRTVKVADGIGVPFDRRCCDVYILYQRPKAVTVARPPHPRKRARPLPAGERH